MDAQLWFTVEADGLPMYLHDIGDDHFHEEDGETSLETNGLWVSDNFQLMSVGVDIGSASTQVVFSKLTLERMGSALSSRYRVIGRESIYRSPIALTPYRDVHRIDAEALGSIIENAYQGARVSPNDVDTGAVILTGEAIRRENAQAISHLLSVQSGRFVCAIAGHNMEALLAAYGSGTVYLSYRHKARILNIDVGGGTTKFAVAERGKVVDTAAIHVGGRLIATDANGCITRLEPGGEAAARAVGIHLVEGERLTSQMKGRIAKWMAEQVYEAVVRPNAGAHGHRLFLTDPLAHRAPYAGIVFSGGVGEYVYDLESSDFGDLGPYLGRELRARFMHHSQVGPMLDASERIRATVLGASEYSLQISGNTLFLTSSKVLPVRNLQVVHAPCDLHHDIDPPRISKQIADHIKRFDLVDGQSDFALSFHWGGPPSYPRLRAFCEALVGAIPESFKGKRQVSLVLDGDIAQSVGRILTGELGVSSPLLVLDGILLQDFDFIDIGRMIQPAGVVPVTVKSLVFEMTQRDPSAAPHVH
ncbi:ethanolamine ammonia-lyase reactivating factor EutA [Alicyclobacillus fastidiosus]|uniref:Ethanolamine ammonia-lyase reactivating factor EutA n=1 Tax=Alicyclobacillus fastidiosus TaxID=392011 RepID=A0ABV5AIP6_9BACL|nr:ethanolamine ammonia-lyase reactivating factor EutA [Alicyclobacillus fastidiosus]WEH07839.1 ethanolamine ammonia-lyase reactivating factor EutA [Alicyclobacillus fastidiosus]